MRDHVIAGRGDLAKSGRHTTSSYFALAAKHGSLVKSMVVDPHTSFAKVGVRNYPYSFPCFG